MSCKKCYSKFKQLGSWLNTRLPECIEDAVQLLLLMDRSTAVGDQLNGVLVSKTWDTIAWYGCKKILTITTKYQRYRMTQRLLYLEHTIEDPLAEQIKISQLNTFYWESIQSFPLRNLRYQKREFQRRRNLTMQRRGMPSTRMALLPWSSSTRLLWSFVIFFLCIFSSSNFLGTSKGTVKKNVVPTPICVTNSIFPPINLTCGQGNLSNQRPTRTMWIWLHKSFLFFPYHYNFYEVYPLH